MGFQLEQEKNMEKTEIDLKLYPNNFDFIKQDEEQKKSFEFLKPNKNNSTDEKKSSKEA